MDTGSSRGELERLLAMALGLADTTGNPLVALRVAQALDLIDGWRGGPD